MDRREAIKRTLLLSGYALSASSLAAVMQGCQVDASPDWEPAFLTREQADLLAELSETILPRTEDSPGARDVHVHRFIDLMLSEYTPEEDRERFRQGLDELAKNVGSAYEGKGYIDLGPQERLEYLNFAGKEAMQAADQQDNAAPRGVPFILALKQAVFTGYFTSEEVGTKVLAYDPIPGEYVPCGSLEELTGGKVWALG